MSQTKYGPHNRYKLTPEHRARLDEWRNLWIANAMSTAGMTEEDKKICREAAAGMYRSAGLDPPNNIVFVASPFVARFVGGAAAWDWHYKSTDDATRDATNVATDVATLDATLDATRAATYDATDVATRAATYAATRAATRAATYDATNSREWYICAANTGWMDRARLTCAVNVHTLWQGGNQWSAFDSFLSFFDRVVGLDLPEYAAWRHWEALSLHSGPRIVHKKFCVISDRPQRLLVDDQNRPHCDDGPFCRWRDGSALYAVHGVRVPAWIIERPEQITVQKIDDEQNSEIRRVMLAKYGEAQYLADSGAESVASDECGMLYRREMPGDEPLVYVRVKNSTPERDGSVKPYWIRVPPTMETARQAVAWTFGMGPDDYRPEVET